MQGECAGCVKESGWRRRKAEAEAEAVQKMQKTRRRKKKIETRSTGTNPVLATIERGPSVGTEGGTQTLGKGCVLLHGRTSEGPEGDEGSKVTGTLEEEKYGVIGKGPYYAIMMSSLWSG